ncbi:GNAT family N-acetyltransferase [Bacteroidota bacterium]
MNDITITELLYSDVDQIRYLQPKGWGDITFFFRMYTRCDFCCPIAAVKNGKIIGVGTGIQNDDTGWIAHIIVSPEYYKKGIGGKLTEHVMHNLEEKGCKTQLLIATQMGEKLYEKLGFKTSCVYDFYEPKKLENNFQSKEIRQLRKEDYEQIIEIDRKVSGEERECMLKMYDIYGKVYEDPDVKKIRGYFFPILGEGMIIATDDEAGLELLRYKHSRRLSKTTIPESNKTAAEFMESSGFKKVLSAPRMVFGKEVNWKPEYVYSRIGGHYA